MFMSRTKSLLAAAVIGAAGFATAAQAATVTITPVVSRYFANQANSLTGTSSSYNASKPPAGIYEIAYKVQTVLSAADTTAGFTGLGNLFFDAIPQGAATLPTHLSVNGDFGPAVYDLGMKYNNAGTRFTYSDPVTGAQVTNGSGLAAGNSLYSTVADLGTAGDFKSLSVEVVGSGVLAGTDPRFNVTQSSQNATYTSTPFSTDAANGQTTIGSPPSIFTLDELRWSRGDLGWLGQSGDRRFCSSQQHHRRQRVLPGWHRWSVVRG